MLTGTKPAAQSRTIQASLAALLIALWTPIVLAVGALLALVGIDVDVQAWTGFAADGAVSMTEWLAILRDVVIAVLAWLAIKYRATATNTVQGIVRSARSDA